jgi:vacuolar protein sorting-associated protein 13A/C
MVFDTFLSKFVEIDTSKTSFSLLSGKIKLQNLKIKDEIFQMFDLPFVEVAHGYVGTISIDLQMPFFYDHAIKVFVDKIFFHARLKNINKLNKQEEIKNIQNLKEQRLLSAEQVFAQVEDVKKQNSEKETNKKPEEKKAPGLVEKIINNLSVEISDIVFKLDDEISYPEIPYTFGVILDNVKIRSTRNDYKIPPNPDEIIPFEEINYKVVAIDNFSVYMDCLDDKEELDYERLISPAVNKKIKPELRNYLRDQLSFYSYCMSEIYLHSRKFEAHQYLLHQDQGAQCKDTRGNRR